MPKPLAKTTHEKKKNTVYPKTVSFRRKSNPGELDHQSDF